MKTFSRIFSRFLHDREASVVVVLSLTILVLFGIAGLAVDFSRGSAIKGRIQAAADAAALAGARTTGTEAQRETAARAAFDADLKIQEGYQNVVLTPSNIVQDGLSAGYRVVVNADVQTTFGKVFGVNEVSVSVLAEANGGFRAPTEVALVLDTTASMDGWKMTTLKQAATKMIDDLNALSTAANPIRYGVVPFSQYVNIGMANRNKPWMNVPADWTEMVTPSCYEEPSGGWTNCTSKTVNDTCEDDGVSYPCSWEEWTCDPVGPMKTVCDPAYPEQHTWKGCAGSRAYPLNLRDENYANQIPGVLDRECGTEMRDLTTSASDVKATINSLTASGDTYIPSGLIWGWRMLSAQEPLAAKASSPGNEVRKFMVLMTDGLNTRSPNYPYNDDYDGDKANQFTAEVCANIAADKTSAITLYTVAFNVSDANTKNLLKNCATATGGQFFDAATSTDFLAVFNEIGAKISGLRLSR